VKTAILNSGHAIDMANYGACSDVQPAFLRICTEGMSLKFCNIYLFQVHPNVANARLSNGSYACPRFDEKPIIMCLTYARRAEKAPFIVIRSTAS